MSAALGLAEPPQHLGHQLGVPAGQDRQAHAVHVLGHRRGRDLRGSEPDAGVDHLEPGVAGPDGDLLDAVGVPVEAGLAEQQAQPARPDLGRGGVAPPGGPRPAGCCSGRGGGGKRADAGGGPVLTEHLAQREGPLAGGDAGPGAGQGGVHQVDVRVLRVGLEPGQGGAAPPPGRGAAATRARSASTVVLVGRVHQLDHGVGVRGERAGLGGLEAVDAHHLVLTGLDARPPGRVRGDQPGLEVPRLHRRDHPAQLRDLGQSPPRRRPPARPSWPRPRASRRTGRRTRAGPTRRPAPAGCAGSTAGPRAGAGPAPRSRRAAGWRGPGRSWTG